MWRAQSAVASASRRMPAPRSLVACASSGLLATSAGPSTPLVPLVAPVAARRSVNFGPHSKYIPKLADRAPEPEYNEDTEGRVIVDGIDYTGYLPAEEFKETHLQKLYETFGEGTGELYRALYKELADEMRREAITKPPPPSTNLMRNNWAVHHKPGTNYCRFTSTYHNSAEIVIGARLAMRDPNQINEVLSFLSWYPLEVLIRRDAYIYHFQVAVAECQFFPRNWRVYFDPTGELMNFEDPEVNWQRFVRRYDGPCRYHLELDMQTELMDLVFDHNVTGDVGRYMGEWVFYLEHVENVRWLRGMMDTVLPDTKYIEHENQLLSRDERRALDEKLEEWRTAALQ